MRNHILSLLLEFYKFHTFQQLKRQFERNGITNNVEAEEVDNDELLKQDDMKHIQLEWIIHSHLSFYLQT